MDDLSKIPSSELVEMLLKHTEYYLALPDGKIAKAECKKNIDLLTEEIRSREGYKDSLLDNDLEAASSDQKGLSKK